MSVLERARGELAAGRPWKARQRLEGALANDPTNQDVLELLGEICFEMGDLPSAGAYWFLTERDGEDVAAAHAALAERWPTPRALFAALPVKARVDAYPARVRARLEALLADESTRWLFAKKTRGIGRKGRDPRTADDEDGDGILVAALGVLFFILLVGPWIVGLITLVVLLVRLLGRLF